ncbi:Putative LOC100868636, partial [Caligus rogercresseyi]
MMPYNKSPKTLGNSIRMGIRQIRAYFAFFPRAEKCGAMLRWSQSKDKPVKEIEMTIRTTAGPNGEKLFFLGRSWTINAIVKAKGLPEDRVYKFTIGHVFTPGYIENTFKIKFQRKGISGIMPDYSYCMTYNNKYPDFSPEFMGYDKNSVMKVVGDAKIQYGHNSDCNSAPGEVAIKFEHSTTQEARQSLKNTWYYKKCMEEKALPAWEGRGDRFPVTHACYLTVWDATTARKYSFKVDFVKMTDRMNAIVSQFQSLMKAGLLPYWDIDPETVPASSAEPHMNFDMTFKENDKAADIYMETSQGGQHFNDIPLSLAWYPFMRNLKFTSTLKKLMKYRIVNACTVTTGSVMTLDNMTYPYDPTSCWTLASGHCAPNPSFAIFTKKASGNMLDAKIYVGGHSVEFQTSGPKKVNVLVNGEAVVVGEKEHDHKEGEKTVF